MCGGSSAPTYQSSKTVINTEDNAAVATREAILRAKKAQAYGRGSTIFAPTGRDSMLGAALASGSTPKPVSFGGGK